MTQSASLSFGPDWMRPKPSRSSSAQQQQQGQQQQPASQPNAWRNGNSSGISTVESQNQTPPSSSSSSLANGIKSNGVASAPISQGSRAKSLDNVLEIWASLQQKLQNEGYEEKYRSLEPIRNLIAQVEQDRSLQQGSQRKDDTNLQELSSQLDEINSWANKEQNGFDFSSILQKVSQQQQHHHQQQQQQQQQQHSSLNLNTQSPFLNRSISMNNEPASYSSLNSPLSASLGFQQQQQPQLLPPDQINWYYLDPAGNQQGPFNGVSMSSWLAAGYLSTDLKIKREGEFTYSTLGQLMITLNTSSPFTIPLPSLTATQQSSSNLTGFFNQGFVQHQPQPQSSHHQQTQQPWGSSESGRSSPWISQPNINQSSALSSSSIFGQSYSNQTSAQPQDDDIFNQIHSQVLNNVLKDEEPQVASITNEVVTSVQIEPAQATAPIPVPEAEAKPIKTTPSKTSTRSESKSKSHEIKSQPPVDSTVEVSGTSLPAPKVKASKKQQPQQSRRVTTDLKASEKPPQPQLAPWAKSASTNTVPALTLQQIQQLDAEENAKQMKTRAENDKLIAAQLLANTEKSLKESETSKAPALPSNASWATPTKTSAPVKTLLDIQREEAEAEATRAAQAAQASQAARAAAIANGTPVASTASTLSSTPKNSFASIANSSTSNNNAWTTVAAKKPVTKTQASQPVIHSTIKANTPDVLRSVSATSTVPTQSSMISKSVSPRQEFLTWCRNTLKLNRGVKMDDVLQVLLMLPVGSESSEIIADTIYSNSSTMDGRRFAQEFMKRRKQVESQVNDGLTWNDALHISSTEDNDGWDFQVVSKKKGKKRN